MELKGYFSNKLFHRNTQVSKGKQIKGKKNNLFNMNRINLNHLINESHFINYN